MGNHVEQVRLVNGAGGPVSMSSWKMKESLARARKGRREEKKERLRERPHASLAETPLAEAQPIESLTFTLLPNGRLDFSDNSSK